MDLYSFNLKLHRVSVRSDGLWVVGKLKDSGKCLVGLRLFGTCEPGPKEYGGLSRLRGLFLEPT